MTTIAGLQPNLSYDHLERFVARLREQMPNSLWQVIEPWSHKPRDWVGDVTDPDDAEHFGLAVPPTAEALAELHAPIKWHEFVGGLSEAYLRHPSPTIMQLSSMWDRLEAIGLRPAVTVALGPWRPGWDVGMCRPPAGSWAIDVLGVSGSGRSVDMQVASELHAVLNGDCADLLDRVPPQVFTVEKWAYWHTV